METRSNVTITKFLLRVLRINLLTEISGDSKNINVATITTGLRTIHCLWYLVSHV